MFILEKVPININRLQDNNHNNDDIDIKADAT